MKKRSIKLAMLLICVVTTMSLAACAGKKEEQVATDETTSVEEQFQEEVTPDEMVTTDETDGVGDTLDLETANPDATIYEEPTEEEIKEDKSIDFIMFMGQSNMSGCGGDATLAPRVIEVAGHEFRAVSDPTRLYPISEPFGINENNINGIMEKPGGKKGSLVSAFVNEYYQLTNTPVIAVSASLGETTMAKWLQKDISTDVVTRFLTTKTWLEDNGYNIKHAYMIWLQGESDGLAHTDTEVYKTEFDDFIRPLFIDGLQQVFIITPGRTLDATETYASIIKVQKQMCKESGYYALATTVLSGVSAEYMVDQYHYNQHVLNLVGTQAAKSVAYFANTGKEKIVYDYKEHEYFVPNGSEELMEDAEPEIDLSDINNRY